MQYIYSSLAIVVILFLFPLMGGSLLCQGKKVYAFEAFIKGIFVDWGLFFVVSVPLIMLMKSLSLVGIIYLAISSLLVITGFFLIALKKKVFVLPQLKPGSRNEILLICLVLIVIGYQIYKTMAYAYADGDDAYYIATAQVANISDQMYLNDPYRGNAIPLNYRYSFAPFPMWIAFLARITKLNVSLVAHSIVAPYLVGISYLICYLITRIIFDNREKRLLLLYLQAIFSIFANVSTSTVETFLLTRSRQGKAALAGIVIPYLFFYMLKAIKKEYESHFNMSLLLAIETIMIGLSAATASMFGNIVYLIAMLFLAGYLLIIKHRLSDVVKVLATCIPNFLILFAYIIIR